MGLRWTRKSDRRLRDKKRWFGKENKPITKRRNFGLFLSSLRIVVLNVVVILSKSVVNIGVLVKLLKQPSAWRIPLCGKLHRFIKSNMRRIQTEGSPCVLAIWSESCHKYVTQNHKKMKIKNLENGVSQPRRFKEWGISNANEKPNKEQIRIQRGSPIWDSPKGKFLPEPANCWRTMFGYSILSIVRHNNK